MRWNVKSTPSFEKVTALSKALGIENTLAKLLVQRGIDSFDKAKHFFRPNLEDLHDPFLMKDMEKAVKRIETAVFRDENILVYGDYDVDGTTSVALLSSYLKSFYPNVATYIPDRYEEGYGISYQGIDYASDNEISLIIALDCGIKAVDKVAYAAEKGIDFIICDHHRPGDNIPQAVAVLDPKREDCSYPYDELCGCGVGFKLIQAFAQKNGTDFEELLPYLDLVATAIAADIVPMTGGKSNFGIPRFESYQCPSKSRNQSNHSAVGQKRAEHHRCGVCHCTSNQCSRQNETRFIRCRAFDRNRFFKSTGIFRSY